MKVQTGKSTASVAAPAPAPVPRAVAWERLQFISSELKLMLDMLTDGVSLRPGVASPELIAVFMMTLPNRKTFYNGTGNVFNAET